MSERSKPWGALMISGVASALCYTLLFIYQKEVMAAFTRTDGWYPVLPVVTAFVFSFAHGAFTGYFWEVLGVTARQPQKETAPE
jgi:phosphate/sulfate permease